MHLLIRDPDHVSYDLVRQADGAWRGRRLLHNEAAATLLAAGSGPAKTQPAAAGIADALLHAIGYPSHSAADWMRFTEAAPLLAH